MTVSADAFSNTLGERRGYWEPGDMWENAFWVRWPKRPDDRLSRHANALADAARGNAERAAFAVEFLNRTAAKHLDAGASWHEYPSVDWLLGVLLTRALDPVLEVWEERRRLLVHHTMLDLTCSKGSLTRTARRFEEALRKPLRERARDAACTGELDLAALREEAERTAPECLVVVMAPMVYRRRDDLCHSLLFPIDTRRPTPRDCQAMIRACIEDPERAASNVDRIRGLLFH